MDLLAMFDDLGVEDVELTPVEFNDMGSGPAIRLPQPEPVFEVPAPPTKQRIRAYSPEYWEWVGKKADPEPEEEQVQSPLVDCEPCGGTGVFVGRNYQTRCARCKGDGVLQPGHIKMFRNWQKARAAGMPRVRSDFGAAFNL